MEHGNGLDWAEMIEGSALSAAIRQSFVLYPLANTSHVIGMALIVGAIVALDLRLLGFGRGIGLQPASLFLTRIASAGLLIAVPSGVTMFLADASHLATNWVFQTKLALVGLALTNALLFRALWGRGLAVWDAAPPLFGRTQVLLSLGLWISAAFGGRLIAYF